MTTSPGPRRRRPRAVATAIRRERTAACCTPSTVRHHRLIGRTFVYVGRVGRWQPAAVLLTGTHGTRDTVYRGGDELPRVQRATHPRAGGRRGERSPDGVLAADASAEAAFQDAVGGDRIARDGQQVGKRSRAGE